MLSNHKYNETFSKHVENDYSTLNYHQRVPPISSNKAPFLYPYHFKHGQGFAS